MNAIFFSLDVVESSRVSKILRNLSHISNEKLKAVLLDFGEDEVQEWQQRVPSLESTSFSLEYAGGCEVGDFISGVNG